MNAERLLAHYEQIADAPDAIARLRRFILDLAVRGKLVPQDANDEPASELLKRIAKEKARLDEAGEISNARANPSSAMNSLCDSAEDDWQFSVGWLISMRHNGATLPSSAIQPKRHVGASTRAICLSPTRSSSIDSSIARLMPTISRKATLMSLASCVWRIIWSGDERVVIDCRIPASSLALRDGRLSSGLSSIDSHVHEDSARSKRPVTDLRTIS